MVLFFYEEILTNIMIRMEQVVKFYEKKMF